MGPAEAKRYLEKLKRCGAGGGLSDNQRDRFQAYVRRLEKFLEEPR